MSNTLGSDKAYRFHTLCGSRVKLSNGNKTAERLKAKVDFNNGLVFSDRKLVSGQVFQVRVDVKVTLWTGSLEIGVTSWGPNQFIQNNLPVPSSTSELKNGSTWMMAARSVFLNGQTIIQGYGFNLEELNQGDTVGVMRTSQGKLVFFVNGTSQGVAAQFIPEDIYVVLNVYGRCSQVSLMDVSSEDFASNICSRSEDQESSSAVGCSSLNDSTPSGVVSSECDKIRFHSNYGALVKLTNNGRTAERRRPMEEFNNAVVLTHRPLKPDELFQIRIDSLVQKWSGSLELGLTTQNPENFEFPATITIMKEGTVVMSGNGILHDGKAANTPLRNVNLDQLQEGDRIGVLRNADSEVHYFINGVDMGVATTGVPLPVWGAVNLYGMAAKITIVDRNSREEHNLRLNIRRQLNLPSSSKISSSDDQETLLFHPNCGAHAAVINSGMTALRPNATEDFNHGVVLTNRMLKPNELFEVRLDKTVMKWAGSIEIGVTTHSPADLSYPCTMTNVRTGTWMMTGNGIMHNGTSIVDDYGMSLDRLKVGDRVGVMRRTNGNLYFFVNGEDQGCAAKKVSAYIFGVIDLYGQAAQASIVPASDFRPEHVHSLDMSVKKAATKEASRLISNTNRRGISSSQDLKFHHLHGRNAQISENGLVARRPNALSEFNAAIIMSNRALKDNELFEVTIEEMVDRWSGNIEAGVTTIRPEDMNFPNTMTDITHDTIMLSGSSIMKDGNTVTNRFYCNLDDLVVGSRVGVMRKSDATLHYFIDGVDVGIAAFDVYLNVYAVFDLYGQVSQVSLSRNYSCQYQSFMMDSQLIDSFNRIDVEETSHAFSKNCAKNVEIKDNGLMATRKESFDYGIVFSAEPLSYEDIFEIRICRVCKKWGGGVKIGVVQVARDEGVRLDIFNARNLPSKISKLPLPSWYATANKVYQNKTLIRHEDSWNLDNVQVGDRVGVRISNENCMNLYLNGQDMGTICCCLPRSTFYAAVDLYGIVDSVAITSVARSACSLDNFGSAMDDHFFSLETFVLSGIHFDSVHGENIKLSDDGMSAERVEGFDHGIVISDRCVSEGDIFLFKILRVNYKWKASLTVGVVELPSEDIKHFPRTCFSLKYPAFFVFGKSVYRNCSRIKEDYSLDMNSLKQNDVVGLYVDQLRNFHVIVNNEDFGVAFRGVPFKSRYIIDVYGQCEGIQILKKESKLSLRKWSSAEGRKTDKQHINKEQKDISPTLIQEISERPCNYLKMCKIFKKTLCLKDKYFTPEPCTCYCKDCFAKEAPGDEGRDPFLESESSLHCLPKGWVRFPLSVKPRENAMTSSSVNLENSDMTNSSHSLDNVLTTWHVAYHGVEIIEIQQILFAGQLENITHRHNLAFNKDHSPDMPPIIFSPCIHYGANPKFSIPKQNYRGKKGCTARVAVEIFVKPGSYKKTVPTIEFQQESFTTHLDSEHEDKLVEWSTKEQRSIHISALLVRLDEAPKVKRKRF